MFIAAFSFVGNAANFTVPNANENFSSTDLNQKNVASNSSAVYYINCLHAYTNTYKANVDEYGEVLAGKMAYAAYSACRDAARKAEKKKANLKKED